MLPILLVLSWKAVDAGRAAQRDDFSPARNKVFLPAESRTLYLDQSAGCHVALCCVLQRFM